MDGKLFAQAITKFLCGVLLVGALLSHIAGTDSDLVATAELEKA